MCECVCIENMYISVYVCVPAYTFVYAQVFALCMRFVCVRKYMDMNFVCVCLLQTRQRHSKTTQQPHILQHQPHKQVHYMNMIFKGTKKKTRLNADEIKSHCCEILEMFDFLHDKDVFLHSYKRMMVDRLLDPNYSEYTNETDILATLKLKVGGSETQTMESMLNDVAKVKAETLKWHQYLDKHKKSASLRAFQPKVFSDSAWELPQQQITLSRVPHQVEVWIEEYDKYYAVRQNSRHLTYRHDLSNVELSAKYGKRKYRISMTAPQACLLCLFNKEEKLTIPTIENLSLETPIVYVPSIFDEVVEIPVILTISNDAKLCGVVDSTE